MGHKQIVGEEIFSTKIALTKRVRKILYAYEKGETISDQHFMFMLDLLSRHPHADIKIGGGVESMFVDVVKPYNNVGFFLRRQDGTITDFSFVQCVNGGLSHRAKFNKACRTAVRGDIKEFKSSEFLLDPLLKCEVSGVTLVNDDSSHVDHYEPSFNTIVDNFIKLNGSDAKFKDSEDMVTIVEFRDEEFAERFRVYHEEVAVVRVISSTANLRRIN